MPRLELSNAALRKDSQSSLFWNWMIKQLYNRCQTPGNNYSCWGKKQNLIQILPIWSNENVRHTRLNGEKQVVSSTKKSQTHWNECNFINYHFLSQIKIFIGFLQTQKISTVGLNWIMLTIGHCNSSIFLSHQFYPSRYSRTFSNKVVHRFSLAGVHINLSTVLGSLKRG